MLPSRHTALGKQGCCGMSRNLASRRILGAETDLEGSARICMASEDSSVQFSFPKLFWGRKKSSYLVLLPPEQGRQAWWDEFRQRNLSCQKWLLHRDYQAVNGGFTERAEVPPTRLLKSKQENGPWKCNEEISLSLGCQQVRRWERPVPVWLQQRVGTCTVNSMGYSTFLLTKG